MNVTESFKIAIKAIKANWMRSLLTMLGIIIGISSVIMIVGAGDGAKNYIVSMIEEMGSNAVMISVDMTNAAETDYITLDDVTAIKEKVKGVDSCSPMLMGFGSAVVEEEISATAMLLGGNADMQKSITSDMDYGRFFTEEEYNASRPVAVIGLTSAQDVYGYTDVVGKYIEVSSSSQSMRIKIIGVAKIDAMANMMGGSGNTDMMNSMFGGMMGSDKKTVALFMPATTQQKITGAADTIPNLFVMAEDENQLDAVGNATINFLKARHNNGDRDLYFSQNMATYIDLVNTIIGILTKFIAAVGAISLIVGGIGVMNIMLVSVTERTREIGIRKALGARTSHLTTQFLTESVIICLIGGVVGVILGVLGAYTACSVIDVAPSITPMTIGVALLFSCGVGLFFGIYPARKAAKMNPIEALRRE